MYKHILLPTDGSELSATTVRDGVKFAKEIGARVTALHVTTPFHPTELTPSAFTAQMQEHDAKAKESAQRALGVVTESARTAGIPCATAHRVSSSPYEAIIALAGEAPGATSSSWPRTAGGGWRRCFSAARPTRS